MKSWMELYFYFFDIFLKLGLSLSWFHKKSPSIFIILICLNDFRRIADF